jgi:hypothetical protein
VKRIISEVAYGDIPPGAVTQTQGVYYLVMQDSCPPVSQVLFNVGIASGGEAYWQDSIVFDFVTGFNPIPVNVLLSYQLHQNFPNPFNSVTEITFNLLMNDQVTLKIYNILGEEVANLISAPLFSGSHSVVWDASDFASGVYYYQLTAGSYNAVKKMLLLK